MAGGQLTASQHRFLQDAAHQLRTSITIALGHAELLASELAGRGEQPDILVVVGELTRLKSLSERLLLIAAAQEPEFLCPAPLALDELLAEALRRWRPTARRVWVAGDLEQITVAADRDRLALAMDALLENAVQHTGPGDTIRVSVRRDGPGTVALIVEDSGDGIAPADLEHVFERFWTGPASANPRGTGLGLTLVRAVADGHGGEVRVHSATGAGSRFELLLPATRGAAGPPRPEAAWSEAAWPEAARPEAGLERAASERVDRSRPPRWKRPLRRPGPPGRKHRRPIAVAVATGLVGFGAVIAVVSATTGPGRPAPPAAAPAFTLPSLRDPAQAVSLTAYRGQPVIVNFFASWCPPCQQETPLLVRFSRASADRTVIIGVDADDSPSAARKFLARLRISYPVAFESAPGVADAYGVSATGIPETFFLNASHHIVKRVIGDVTMRELDQYSTLMKG